MPEKSGVFEITYKDYLTRLGGVDLDSVKDKLDIQVIDQEAIIPLFNQPFKVSTKGISDLSGKKPSLDVCVILSKYLLMCPKIQPEEDAWVSYKDFKDSAPLISYFSNDVERAITDCFLGRMDALEKASMKLGGVPPKLDAMYDLRMQFDALPRVPMVMLFNDGDDEFPPQCHILFERRAEKYLDPESLAMAGRLLFVFLKRAKFN